MSQPILDLPTHRVNIARARVEARLEAARKARGCAYTAADRDHAIVEYLAKNEELKKLDEEYRDALLVAVELDLEEAGFNG